MSSSEKARSLGSRIAKNSPVVGSASLRRRVIELESEVQEIRHLNRRLAEVLDVMEELLVPLAQRDEEKVRQYLESRSASL